MEPKSRLIWLGDRRDGLLIVATTVYVLGYLSWAVHASRENFGLLPVLDAQYFAAGLFPALTIGTFAMSAWLLFALHKWCKQPLEPSMARYNGWLKSIAGVLGLAGLVLIIAQKGDSAWAGILMFASVFIGYTAVFFSRKRGDQWFQRFALGIAWFYVVLGLFALLWLYVEKLFPNFYHEIGGPKATPVQLDISTAHVSPETLRDLLPETSAQTSNPVVRSKLLFLVFSGSHHVLVKETADRTSVSNRIFRLSQNAVESIIPLPAPIHPMTSSTDQSMTAR